MEKTTPAAAATPAKTGNAETPADEEPSLRESAVRAIINESIANFQQKISKEIAKAIDESVKNTFAGFSQTFMDNFEGKQQNQRELIANVKNQMGEARNEIQKSFEEVKALFPDKTSQAKEEEEGEILRALPEKLSEARRWLQDIQKKLSEISNEIQTQKEAIPDEDENTELPPIDANGAAKAAVSLAEMSAHISKMSEGLFSALEKVSGMGPRFQNVPDKIDTASRQLDGIAIQLSNSIASLTAPDGAMARFSDSANRLAAMASDSVNRLEGTISGAETRLAESHKSLEGLVRRLSDGLDTPRMIRDEVVPKLGSFFDKVADSVKGLSDRVTGLKDQIDQIGDVSKFQEKALLAIRFGEVCKRLQEEFDKSLGQIDPPSPQTGSTDGN